MNAQVCLCVSVAMSLSVCHSVSLCVRVCVCVSLCLLFSAFVCLSAGGRTVECVGVFACMRVRSETGRIQAFAVACVQASCCSFAWPGRLADRSQLALRLA